MFNFLIFGLHSQENLYLQLLNLRGLYIQHKITSIFIKIKDLLSSYLVLFSTGQETSLFNLRIAQILIKHKGNKITLVGLYVKEVKWIQVTVLVSTS